MRFEPRPVSRLEYLMLNPDAQILVCVNGALPGPSSGAGASWKVRAAAVFSFIEGTTAIEDVVLDVLANPQIRAIVFEGTEPRPRAFDAFWGGQPLPRVGMRGEHLALVRQFVDLYDGDCGIHSVLPPFWPSRILHDHARAAPTKRPPTPAP